MVLLHTIFIFKMLFFFIKYLWYQYIVQKFILNMKINYYYYKDKFKIYLFERFTLKIS